MAFPFSSTKKKSPMTPLDQTAHRMVTFGTVSVDTCWIQKPSAVKEVWETMLHTYIQNMHCYNNTKFKVPSRFHFLESSSPHVTHKISKIHHYTLNIWSKNTCNKARCLPMDFLHINYQSAISWNIWHTHKNNNPIINKARFLVGNLIYTLRYEMSAVGLVIYFWLCWGASVKLILQDIPNQDCKFWNCWKVMMSFHVWRKVVW